MLCWHYCARTVVMVATPLHIEQGGLGHLSVCLPLSVCVCVCACVHANPETMSTKHSVSPEPTAYTRSTTYMSTEYSVSDELSAFTKPTYRTFHVLPAFSIH